MAGFDPSRREWLRQSLALGGAAAAGLAGMGSAGAGASPAPDPHPASGRAITRIGFGSCAKQDKPQPIWDAINALEPELFIFLGDNIYGDTVDMAELAAKYEMLGAIPGFRRLSERTEVLAIWDDHDYGENDAGAGYPMKEESRRIFCDFWGEAADSPRRRRDGIYAAYVFGPAGQRLQLILPDLRFNRTPILARDLAGTEYKAWAESLHEAGKPVYGPYERNPEPAATMLGENQWRWLEDQLSVPAEVRLLCSSLQVVADFPGWEAWINYAHDHQRLIDAIRRQRANGLICISGDTHYAELSRLDVNVPYPLWDLTSSGLTEVWPVLPPNALRVGEAYRDVNFGWIEIDWTERVPSVRLQVRDISGAVRIEHRLDVGSLAV
ncbi:MAG: alkaline phosphatase family protein [Steroidobacteraceae bacterium]|jgi:alkaline phosphatase D|nr:alkaline phosphatase family protein [Steroidobacteraceae bacterium]